MNLAFKQTQTGVSIFSVMTALAQEYGALNMAQGFPDFDCDPLLLQLAHTYMSNAKLQQYAPMPGVLSLREVVSRIYSTEYKAQFSAEHEITITAGGTQALYTAFSALLEPGDEVILFEPAYDSYAPAIYLQGAKPVGIPLLPPFFEIDWDLVNRSIGPKTKAILINNPHNPTGKVWSESDLNQISALALKHRLYVIADEVYEHMVFDGLQHHSIAGRKELRECCVLIGSFGKTLHATGWKIGTLSACKSLTRIMRQVHQFQVFAVNHPLQHAIADYLSEPSRYQNIKGFYENRRNMFLKALDTQRWQALPCQGTYFQLLDYSACSNLPDTQLAEILVKKHGIACIPVSVFYSQNPKPQLLRICFAKSDATLFRAAECLNAVQGL